MNMGKGPRKLLVILSIVIGVMALFYFLFRNFILHWTVDKVIERVKTRTGATLTIGESGFSGFSAVHFKDISLVPRGQDTILTVSDLMVDVYLLPLLTGTLRLSEVEGEGMNVFITCKDKICNYESLIHGASTEKTNVTVRKSERNYALLFRRVLDNAFNLIPQKAQLKEITLRYSNDTLSRKILVNEFRSDESSLHGTVEDVHSTGLWLITGRFSQSDRSVAINVTSGSDRKNHVPLLYELAGLAIDFDSIHAAIDGYRYEKGELKTKGEFSVSNYDVFHRRISDDTVRIPSASFRFSFRAGKDFVMIDSTSEAKLNSIAFAPFASLKKGNGNTYTLSIRTAKTKSVDFFRSLPAGVFDEVREITADGTLQYMLDFSINSQMPDSVYFESTLRKEKFRIRKFGDVNLLKMNGPFIHHVYERNRIVRSFAVSDTNKSFTPLSNISPHFINAVLTSEDGNFFTHNGFNEEAFRKSIAANFKAGRFVRGGSTITMQLVKNVFLTRKKTIARKAEEALLVWLIESNNLYTKDRMLEVYMNIIELGPNIYGIGEAAPFYFDKKPADLTLPEGIFLASLLPHPKWFKYSFDTLGNLKPYLAGYYNLVSDHMLRRELITQQQHDELQPNVTLKGPAKELVLPKETIPEEEEEEDD